ncbi:MAG: four helix bundle protein, partial [Bacteroidetes bacterium]|nr:four helix bundle protein [Bacteroidota bacterium]
YPKAYRYNLGERIMTGFLDVLDLILESRYTSGNKRHLLRQTNIRLEKLRYLIRLSKYLRCILS